MAPLKELEARGITFDADTKQMLSVHHEAADLSAQQVCTGLTPGPSERSSNSLPGLGAALLLSRTQCKMVIMPGRYKAQPCCCLGTLQSAVIHVLLAGLHPVYAPRLLALGRLQSAVTHVLPAARYLVICQDCCPSMLITPPLLCLRGHPTM